VQQHWPKVQKKSQQLKVEEGLKVHRWGFDECASVCLKKKQPRGPEMGEKQGKTQEKFKLRGGKDN